MSCWAVICSYAISAPASEGHMQIRVVLKAQETQPGLLREVLWWVSSSSTSQHEAKFLSGGFLSMHKACPHPWPSLFFDLNVKLMSAPQRGA